jgi:DMSO/TMAO reductase YedYZ molybdopterin-dependent catalytic subunit
MSPISLVNRTRPILITGVVLIATAIILFTSLYMPYQENIEWDVTLVGSSGEKTTLTYDEIRALPPYMGNGGFFTSVGYINGPYRVRGVPITDLCNLVGGINPQDIVFVSASDGYSTVLDYNQAMGDFITYDPTTMKEVAHGELRLLLAYELDGRMLSPEEGRPVRLAIAGDDNLLTEGLYWVKWVEKIEIIQTNAQANLESE